MTALAPETISTAPHDALVGCGRVRPAISRVDGRHVNRLGAVGVDVERGRRVVVERGEQDAVSPDVGGLKFGSVGPTLWLRSHSLR